LAIDPGLASLARELFRTDRYWGLMAIIFELGAVPLAIIDIKERRIPDRILLPIGAMLIALDAVAGGIDFPALAAAVATSIAMIGAGRLSRSGMGMGDVKMGAAGAFALGPAGAWLMLIAAAMLGIAYGIGRTRNRENRYDIPFAPFLAIGAACAIGVRLIVFKLS